MSIDKLTLKQTTNRDNAHKLSNRLSYAQLARKQVTTMRWLHLSDLHFNPIQDGTDTSYLRDRMINYLQDNNSKLRSLFVTR